MAANPAILKQDKRLPGIVVGRVYITSTVSQWAGDKMDLGVAVEGVLARRRTSAGMMDLII